MFIEKDELHTILMLLNFPMPFFWAGFGIFFQIHINIVKLLYFISSLGFNWYIYNELTDHGPWASFFISFFYMGFAAFIGNLLVDGCYEKVPGTNDWTMPKW